MYTHHRDSGLLDQSNADVIAEAMERFLDQEPCDVIEEHHRSWLCGWIDGYAIRVYRNGKITKAFRTYHELSSRLADYPVLDEEDYCEKEREATLENIADAAWRLKRQYDLPDNWENQVYRWLWDNEDSELGNTLENTDDQGGVPTEEALRRAFDALGYQIIE